jgi:hypothetical protein
MALALRQAGARLTCLPKPKAKAEVLRYESAKSNVPRVTARLIASNGRA